MASVSSVSAVRNHPRVQAGGQGQPGAMSRVMDTLSLKGNIDSVTKLGRVANAGYAALKGGEAGVGSAQGVIQALKSFDIGPAFSSLKSLAQGALPFATKAAGVQGALSLLANGYRAVTGKISYAEAGSRVVGDTTSGFVGGASGAVAGAFGVAALGMLGVTGGLLTLGGAALGMVGFFVGERWFKQSNVYRTIKNKTREVLDYGFRPLETKG